MEDRSGGTVGGVGGEMKEVKLQRREERRGHTESFLISKSWTLTPAFFAILLKRNVVGALEVYR
jgi:hypothetical protein